MLVFVTLWHIGGKYVPYVMRWWQFSQTGALMTAPHHGDGAYGRAG